MTIDKELDPLISPLSVYSLSVLRCNRLSTESEIRTLLQTGYTPNALIERGFKKSTVYKVFNKNRTFSGQVIKPNWVIENILFDHSDSRYLPGNVITLSFDLVNLSSNDLYVVNVGIQTKWMIEKNVWLCQSVKDILKPKQRRKISLSFQVPNTMALGEYELLFGLEGQYLPVQGYLGAYLFTSWTEPIIINVKYPLTGESIFLSHSTRDIYVIRELEAQFDNYGIQILIGEDNEQPGRILEEKFMEMIRSSTLFLAILTHDAARSQMVRGEIRYALNVGKRCILLKEKSLSLDWNVEWIPFSKDDTPVSVFQTVMAALEKVKKDQGLRGSPIISILAVALFSFVLGWCLRR